MPKYNVRYQVGGNLATTELETSSRTVGYDISEEGSYTVFYRDHQIVAMIPTGTIFDICLVTEQV